MSGYTYELLEGGNYNDGDALEVPIEGTTTSGELTLNDLDDNNSGEYYFLVVKALSGSGVESSSASYFIFRIDSSPPASLTVYSTTHPLDSVIYSSTDATFKWMKPTDITGVEEYYVFAQIYNDDDITILSNGNPSDLTDWTLLEVDTNDTITYQLYLPEIIDPDDYTALNGSVCFAIAAVDYSGNISFSERIVNYDVEIPVFTYPGTASVSVDGDVAVITWPEIEDTDDLFRYMVKIDKYQESDLILTSEWINNSTATEFEFIGVEEGYQYKVYVKIQDNAVPANEDALLLEFSIDDGVVSQDTPAVQPYSFLSKGYRIWGEVNSDDNTDENNSAYLQIPDALEISITGGVLDSDFTDESLLLYDSVFYSGIFTSGNHPDVEYSISPGGRNLVGTGLSFTTAYGLELAEAVMDRRISADEVRSFTFNNLLIDSPIEGTFDDNISVAQDSFDYQYQSEQEDGSFVSSGWMLSGIESTMLSGSDWNLIDAEINVNEETGFEFYSLSGDEKIYNVNTEHVAIEGNGEVRYGTIDDYPYYLELGDLGTGGSKLEILNAALIYDRLAVFDSVIMFADDYNAEDEDGNPIDVHLRNFSLTLDGELELYDKSGGNAFSSDEFYLVSPYSDYRIKVDAANISSTGISVDGHLVGDSGSLSDSSFYGLELCFEGLADEYTASIPGSGYSEFSGFTVNYTGRSLTEYGIRLDGAEVNMSAFDDGLTAAIAGLTVDVEDRTLITVPGYCNNSFALETPDYGIPDEGESLLINILRLDNTGLWGESVDVSINSLLGENYVYSELPLLSTGYFGESAMRESAGTLTLSGFTFTSTGSTFNGKRISFLDSEIVMPDGAYPFELGLDVFTSTIDVLSLNINEDSRYTFSDDWWTFLLESVDLTDDGLVFKASTSMPGKFGGKTVTFEDFTLYGDGTYSTGTTEDLDSQSVFFKLADWIFEGRQISINGESLNIGRAFFDFPKRMGDGSLQFRDMIIARDGELVAQGICDSADSFESINGFNVEPSTASIESDGLYLSGKVYFPEGLGAGNYVNYSDAEILLSGDGFITTSAQEYPEEEYSIGGLPVTAQNYAFTREGLYIGENTISITSGSGGIGVYLEDVIFYPDGTISVGGELLEDPEPLPFLSWVFTLENIRITDLGLAVDAGIEFPEELGGHVINFNGLTLYKDESGELKIYSDVVIPQFDFDLVPDQLNVDFRYLSLVEGDLEIKETIITLPDAMDNHRVRIGTTTYSSEDGFDLGGISVDPFDLWGYTLYLDNFDIDNDMISFEGHVKLPDDFYFTEMAGETFTIAQLDYDFESGNVIFDIQYDGTTFELDGGWKIDVESISLRDNGFSIGSGHLLFPEDWTAVDGRISVDSVGFNDLEIVYSPFTADFENIEANNILVSLDDYEFTINKIEYSTSDGFVLAGTFPLDDVFQGDSPVLNVERLQITTDFQFGDLIASLDGLDQELYTGLNYAGSIGVSYVDDIIKMNAGGSFVFSENFVLEELIGTSIDISSFEYNVSSLEIINIDADWSADTIELFDQTVNYPAIAIDYNTSGVDDGISISGNYVLPQEFPGLGNEEFMLSLKADFTGTLTYVSAGISVTGPKKFIGDTWLQDFNVAAGLNDTKDGILLDMNGTLLLGDTFPRRTCRSIHYYSFSCCRYYRRT